MFRILLSAFLLVLVGCSSLPPKTQAIHQALVTDSALREAKTQCSAMGGDERRTAEREHLDWWNRNGAYVLAADYGILQLNWDGSAEKAESQRAVLAMQVLENIQIDADTMLTNWFADYDEAEECQRLFTAVKKGDFDLDSSKKQKAVLEELKDQRQDVSNDAKLALSINTRFRKYGRSLYVVEKTLAANGCVKPEIALIRNSWPIETYDAACNGEDYLIVQCEWGRCALKR